MAQCTFCGAETYLYDSGAPICIKCSEAQRAKRKAPEIERHIRTTLIKDLAEATLRAKTASDAFNSVMSDIPSTMPHSDGTQRIHNASRDLSFARKEMMKAHS